MSLRISLSATEIGDPTAYPWVGKPPHTQATSPSPIATPWAQIPRPPNVLQRHCHGTERASSSLLQIRGSSSYPKNCGETETHAEDSRAENHQQSSALQGREHGHRSIEMGGASNGGNPGLNHHPLDYLVEAAIGVGTLRRTHPPLGDFDSLPTALPTGCADGHLQPSS